MTKEFDMTDMQEKKGRGRPRKNFDSLDAALEKIRAINERPTIRYVASLMCMHEATLARAIKEGRVRDWRKP